MFSNLIYLFVQNIYTVLPILKVPQWFSSNSKAMEGRKNTAMLKTERLCKACLKRILLMVRKEKQSEPRKVTAPTLDLTNKIVNVHLVIIALLALIQEKERRQKTGFCIQSFSLG